MMKEDQPLPQEQPIDDCNDSEAAATPLKDDDTNDDYDAGDSLAIIKEEINGGDDKSKSKEDSGKRKQRDKVSLIEIYSTFGTSRNIRLALVFGTCFAALSGVTVPGMLFFILRSLKELGV